MQSTRWWSLAVVGTVTVQAVILILDDPRAGQLALGLTAMAVFLVTWFALGRRCGQGTRASVAFVAVTVIFSGVVTLVNPSLAIVQCIAFPLVWTSLRSLRASLIANVAVAVAAGAAISVNTGSWAQGVVIEAISLGLSIGLGLWITSIAVQSDLRQHLLDELQATQAELALLSREAGITSERDRLAREIHDTIAQDLTGIVLVAQRASRELASGADLAASLALLEESARAALAETRSLVASTASPGLEGGLIAAVERLAARFTRECAIAVEVEIGTVASLDRDTEVVLLRVAQEGLANVRKHSGATRVTIAIENRTLTVCDNGHGFDPAIESTGFGLTGMRERLALVGGSLDIASGTDGTTVRVVA